MDELSKDVLGYILQYCSIGLDYVNVRVINKKFNKIIQTQHNIREKGIMLLKSCIAYFDQTDLFKAFKDKLVHQPSNALEEIVNDFKESMIDLFSDVEKLDLHSISGQYKEILRDLYKLSRDREVADVFLYPNSAQIVGTCGKDDIYGRHFGDYGLKLNGPVVSVQVFDRSN